MMQASTKQQLKQYIERAEKLEEEVGALKDDLKNVFAEAKANGFDPKIMKKVIALRKKDKSERDEEQAVLDTYLSALGMLADTPLGVAAVESKRRSMRGEEAMA